MNNINKIIKYLSMAFALSLAIFIIYTVASIFFSLTNSIIGTSHVDNLEADTNINEKYDHLDIELMKANIEFKVGDHFKVKHDDENIKITRKNDRIKISENKKSIFKGPETVIVYVPNDMTFDYIEIETGAGDIQIDKLMCDNFEFELGAGKTIINELYVKNQATIEGGAGKIQIDDGKINNLVMELGTGKLSLNADILGNSKIDAGIGEVDITLTGSKESYQILAKKGLGSLKIDKEKVENNLTYGHGQNIVNINGGIGTIDIEFMDSRI